MFATSPEGAGAPSPPRPKASIATECHGGLQSTGRSGTRAAWSKRPCWPLLSSTKSASPARFTAARAQESENFCGTCSEGFPTRDPIGTLSCKTRLRQVKIGGCGKMHEACHVHPAYDAQSCHVQFHWDYGLSSLNCSLTAPHDDLHMHASMLFTHQTMYTVKSPKATV